ncbi:hypothetical protein XACS582_14270005 [Xanthomonas citri pv. citri]|uniref:Uncharacterized protein n=1 Tax=Xanthomonas citri pv. citri TaxID=611301 RepID=A0A0U4YLG1_XANCI|nr:hypothetical protein XAC3810_330041 [Xanthomonas citri pv. citri]CEE60168.1 hypothetical protein XAC3608_1650005 [Xanthomonas citri pv. citri]CEE78837.1 hypothetical protein XAC3218_1460002 [Xanthomonas citri pv. citri]CEE87111.1 hypothetical protein XACLE20_650044 [Xanthomonas citri pv. citri]CEG16428.1 hypothetical protein XAC3562_370041 [Xanthomonas citri pv. citri]
MTGWYYCNHSCMPNGFSNNAIANLFCVCEPNCEVSRP